MLRLAPFAAIRPEPNRAARIASVPYDVVTTAEAKELAAGNPLSFLHVVRPEIDLPPETNPYDEIVYRTGRDNLERLRTDGALFQDEERSIYLYRQVMNHQPQIGLVACCHVDDYTSGLIKRHEHTRRVKEDDRTRHVLTLNANTGPVLLTYRDSGEIDRMVAQDTNQRPLYHFDSVDGVTHTVWKVRRPAAYAEAFRRVPAAYVADGHHRSASAARAALQRREANPSHSGDEEYNWFLAVLFPASQLNILPYNRTIQDLGGLTFDEVLARLAQVGTLTKTEAPRPDRPGVSCFYFGQGWHRLEIDPATIDSDDPVNSLDVAVLHARVLAPIFGIGDERTDDRIDFVGGIRGTAELERRVDTGVAAAAVSLHATTIDQLMTVADAGLIMPPKSTWFEPKLRSGLFVHALDAPDAPK